MKLEPNKRGIGMAAIPKKMIYRETNRQTHIRDWGENWDGQR